MSIEFPAHPVPVYKPSTTMTIAFPAVIDGVDVTCEVSAVALCEHFGVASSTDGTALIEAFERNRATIESVARRILPQRTHAGRCLLVNSDF